MKKIKKIILFVLLPILLFLILGLIILIPILLLLDFFGVNVTNGYVENNSDYADMYKDVVRDNIKAGNGYVSLSRILYFYNENEKLKFSQIYYDNLDLELKQEKPISEVCALNRYKVYSVCNKDEIEESGQINELQNKPFVPPLDLEKLNVTSFFMQERIVYNKQDVHQAWDFGASDESPVYAVCDGTVEKVHFPFETNTIDITAGGGNQITISCDVDDITYKVIYAHLYPKSTTLKVGDSVTQGQKIAGVGTTGYSTGSHLHFEVHKDGIPVDGLSLIDFTNSDSTTINPSYPPISPNPGLYDGPTPPYSH